MAGLARRPPGGNAVRYGSMTEGIGDTPLVRIDAAVHGFRNIDCPPASSEGVPRVASRACRNMMNARPEAWSARKVACRVAGECVGYLISRDEVAGACVVVCQCAGVAGRQVNQGARP